MILTILIALTKIETIILNPTIQIKTSTKIIPVVNVILKETFSCFETAS